jgi:hypothetical protein
LLSCGRHSLDTCEVRYACFARMPGAPPGVGLPDADAATVCRWADQAVSRLNDLHAWTPPAAPARALRQSPVHEGFTGRVALLAEIEGLLAADRDRVISRRLTDGLAAIGRSAPPGAATDVPVHADCDWDNWLTDDQNVTALLDFERARFGDPADDWVLLAATSGPHTALILDAIVERTAASPDALRAACEVRDATLFAQDLRHALAHSNPPVWMRQRIAGLEELVIGQRWWRPARSR